MSKRFSLLFVLMLALGLLLVACGGETTETAVEPTTAPALVL